MTGLLTAATVVVRYFKSAPVAFRKVYGSGRATPWHRALRRESSRDDEFWRCGCLMHTAGRPGPGRFEFSYRDDVPIAERCHWWKARS